MHPISLDSNGIYPHDQLLKAKYDALKETNMITYLSGLHRELNGQDEDAPVPEGECYKGKERDLKKKIRQDLRR